MSAKELTDYKTGMCTCAKELPETPYRQTRRASECREAGQGEEEECAGGHKGKESVSRRSCNPEDEVMMIRCLQEF